MDRASTRARDRRLDQEALDAWERTNQRPALSLKGLRSRLDRPSPFQD